MTEENPVAENPQEEVPTPVEPPTEPQPTQEMSEKMAEDASRRMAAKMRAEESYQAEIEVFQASQAKIMQSAEDTLPPSCPSCQSFVRADMDKLSIEKNAECFGCFTKTETHKTEVAKDTLLAEETGRIASLDLSDYEEWLFGDDMGQITLARLLTKVKREGYNYKPWQVSIGASAWSLDNYHSTGLVETRHIVERMKIKNLLDHIPENTQDIVQVINSVKRAEESIAHDDRSGIGGKPLLILVGVTGVAALLPILLSRR